MTDQNALDHNDMGNVHGNNNDWLRAIEEYHEAIRIDPSYHEPHNNLGMALCALGRVKEAAAEFEKTIELKPDYPDAYNNLAILYKDVGLYAGALRRYQEAIALKPDYLEAHYNLGMLYRRMGLVDRAESEFEKAIKIDGSLAESHNELGNVLAIKGDWDKAIHAYEEALQANMQFEEAKKNLRLAQEERQHAGQKSGRTVHKPPEMTFTREMFDELVKVAKPEEVHVAIEWGAVVDARDPEFGTTPLMLAAQSNSDPQVIVALINAGADANAKDPKYGTTPLMWAAKDSSNPEVAAALLKSGADIHAKNVHGWTALFFAAANGKSSEMIEVLIGAGGDGGTTDDKGNTACSYALANESLKGTRAMDLLMKASQTNQNGRRVTWKDPVIQQVWNKLEMLPEETIWKLDPRELLRRLEIGDPGLLEKTATKLSQAGNSAYSNANYAEAEMIYSFQTKLLRAFLRIRYGTQGRNEKEYIAALRRKAGRTLRFLSGVYFNRANTYDEMNESASWKKAIADFERAIDLGNVNPSDVYFNMGIVHEKLGNSERARDCYRESLREAPRTRDRVERALSRMAGRM